MSFSSIFFQNFLVFITCFSFFLRTVDKVDETMAHVNEQRELAAEIADIIAAPISSNEFDEVSLSLAYPSSIVTKFFLSRRT